MRYLVESPEYSLVGAFIGSPMVTPVLAIPLMAFVPGTYDDPYFVITLLVVCIVSLVIGGLGTLLVLLPVYLALKLAGCVSAARVCVYTTLLGGGAWCGMCCLGSHPSPELGIVGAACSLGVSAYFCLLAGISFRSTEPTH